jgi:glycosyltransferase involved in cell wall biosynthesis
VADITVIIPTYNEEENIGKCIESVTNFAKKIFVIDSFSSDKTKQIAESLGCEVLQGQWSTFSEKINWALDNVYVETKWVMRLDADEVLGVNFQAVFDNTKLTADAYAIKRKFVFLGKELNFGGWGSLWDIRIWRKGHVRMENRVLDEHMNVIGKLKRLNVKVLDDSYKSLPHVLDKNYKSKVSFWIEKHNKYSDLESYSFFKSKSAVGQGDFSARIKRFCKNAVYYKTPLFIRPFIYFIYRYIFLLGFLDGRQGLIIHVLHSFWYRFLVDVKIFERIKSIND